MSNKPVSIHTVVFNEHPHVFRDHSEPHVLDIIVDQPFSHEQYREILFEVVFEIGLSEFVPFLDYQCAQLKDPMSWLNALEKLIHCHTSRFNDPNLVFRREKLLLEIGGTRREIKVSAEHHLPKKPKKKLNGFSDDNDPVYSFDEVLEQISHLQTTAEKILFLNEKLTFYRQHLPKYVCTQMPRFDEQCEMEIKKLHEEATLMLQVIAQKQALANAHHRLPINTEQKNFCYIIAKLRVKTSRNGKPVLPWTTEETIDAICNYFCQPDGTPFNPATIRTYLSPGRFDNIPRIANQINLDKIDL